ncbi:phosphoglycerol transferase I, partial [Escherichia coli]|nr:phosphoglycerol transferase I [Escherichia coli]
TGKNVSSFLSGADCIASELKKNGYYNEFIRGSAKEFAGGDKFLSQHGWDNLIDKQYFIDNNFIQPANISGWGVNDDVLLDFAWKRYEHLSSLN